MRQDGSKRRSRLPIPAWLGLLLAAYLIGPVAAFLVSVADGASASTPGGPAGPGLGAALGVSLASATVATGICAVFGVPLAYLLSRSRSRALAAVGVAVQLPIALPPLMSGLLLLAVIGPYTPLGGLFGGHLTDSIAGVVLAQLFVAAPFLVIAARSAFAGVDPALDEVAATLGRRPFDRFIRVVVPAASKGIAAGLVLAWLRAFGEFGATVVLAYHPYSLPVYTFVQFGSAGLRATVAPLLAALAAAAAAVLLGAAVIRRPARRRVQLPPPRRPAEPAAGQPAASLRLAVAGRAGSFEISAAGGPARHLAILGRSGAGKTLLLRMLIGLAPVDTGEVALAGHDVWAEPMERRRVGYVPQDSALLPGRSVWRQVMLGPTADPAVAAWWLRRLGLEGLADRLPEQLSGGQRRRVALVRALATQPRLLVLDEPFTGLDAEVRDGLRTDLRRLQEETSIATVLVTHDPADAAALSDHLLLMDAGRIIDAGRFGELRRRPAEPAAARLLGLPNIFSGECAGPHELEVLGLRLPAGPVDLPVGEPVMWHVAPEVLRLGRGGAPGRVTSVIDWGRHAVLTVQLAPGLEIQAGPVAAPWPPAGAEVTVGWEPGDVRLWPASTVGRPAGAVSR